MKILMVSSEAAPFAKTGGLADAVSAISRALSERGHDVRIAIPRYQFIDINNFSSDEKELSVNCGKISERATFHEGLLPGSNVRIYFMGHEAFFNRDGIYGTKDEPDFSDNPGRFAFFSRAVFELCKHISWIPDIINAHDWPAAISIINLKYHYDLEDFSDAASVLTIHNLGYQGIYPKEKFTEIDFSNGIISEAGQMEGGLVSILKAGIECADMLATVSPTYAKEIQTPEYGFGLDGLLRSRNKHLYGILNGVDTGIWNPETDPFIPANYSVDEPAGKKECKHELQKEFGLQKNQDIPIIGMVTRLTDQKGIGDLFGPSWGSAYSICKDLKLQMVILGSGEKWCEDELGSLASKLPNFRVFIGYNEKMAHLIQAGSDFCLMPSKYEPCGLNQLYSLKYGTLPIVRKTGGLADTVENYNEQNGDGTGFMFEDLTPLSIYNTAGWACWAWYNKPDHILQMRKKAMSRDFSWNKSASEYEALYHKAIDAHMRK